MLDGSPPSAQLSFRSGGEFFELSDAFARLPEREQLALYLRYWCDLPHADVARRLEMRPDATRQLVRRAIVRLGRLLR